MADAPHSKCGGKPCRFKSDRRYQQTRPPLEGSFQRGSCFDYRVTRFSFSDISSISRANRAM